MRHRKTRPTLDRKAAPRNAMLRSLAISVVMHGRVQTTIAKVRAVRPIVERAITTAKVGTLQSRRQLMRSFTEVATNKLLKDLAPKYKDRQGGYTRRILSNQRQGDRAQMAILELV
ncbi:MAG: 50S ribosomal protein L17 [bacterium]|nr:50S ribosomal protein L17 [bacterium]